MQGGRLVVPTPGVVSAPVVPSPVAPTLRVPVDVGDVEVDGVEPKVDEVIDGVGLSAVVVVPEVPIDPVGELSTVLVEPLKLPADVGELPLSPVLVLPMPVPVLPMLDGELLVPARVPVLVVGVLGVVPGTLVLAPGMPVVAPGTPTLAPGTVDVADGLDVAAPSVPDVGTHGRDPIG
jgi:hypothetical protein